MGHSNTQRKEARGVWKETEEKKTEGNMESPAWEAPSRIEIEERYKEM